MRRLALVLTAAVLAGAGRLTSLAGQSPQPYLSVTVRAQVVVADPEAAGRGLAQWAEQGGGFALLQARDRVVLRLPGARVDDLRRRLIEVSEAVVAYTPSAVDLREERARVESGITSREESLRLVLQYLDEADVAGTLALEKEIGSLVQGIEQLKGTRGRLAFDAEYARVEILLRSQAQTLPQRRPSTFAWINTVDLYRFLEASRGR